MAGADWLGDAFSSKIEHLFKLWRESTVTRIYPWYAPLASTAEATLTPPAVCNGKIKVEAVLGKYFGFNSFRPGQLRAIMPAMHGRDVFVRMATGSGKTLCMFMVRSSCR